MKKFKVVCFDMDGTLITNTNSVEYLCLLNGKEKDVREIELKEELNEISWIEADYIKAELFAGLETKRIEEEFLEHIKMIRNMEKTLKKLRNNDIHSILVTAGPIQVGKVLAKMYKFDEIFGSLYEVKNGFFTGKILKHLGDSGKVESLNKFCSENNIKLEEVVAIGDSASDIKVFEKSGKAIAINYSDKLIGKADVYIRTKDLFDVIEHIIG